MTAWEQKQFNLRILKKCRLSTRISFTLVIVLGLVKLAVVNRAASWGKQVEAVHEETREIVIQNEQLALELNRQGGGLIQLEDEAKRRGFSQTERYVYFDGDYRMAQNLP